MESWDIHSARRCSAALGRPRSPDELMPYLACNWPRVIIHAITVREAPQGTSFGAIRARIGLGALRPSDVRVSVVPLDRPTAQSAAIRLSASAERCRDGSHLFDGVIPTEALTRRRCTVRVTPAAELPAWSYILTPIERHVPRERVGSLTTVDQGSP